MTATDKFIDQQYLFYMLHDYFQNNGEEPYKKLMDEVSATGVNIERLQSYQRAYDEAMLRKQQAAQQQAQAQAEAEAAAE